MDKRHVYKLIVAILSSLYFRLAVTSVSHNHHLTH